MLTGRRRQPGAPARRQRGRQPRSSCAYQTVKKPTCPPFTLRRHSVVSLTDFTPRFQIRRSRRSTRGKDGLAITYSRENRRLPRPERTSVVALLLLAPTFGA